MLPKETFADRYLTPAGKHAIHKLFFKCLQKHSDIPYDGRQGRIRSSVIDHHADTLPRPITM